MTFLSRSLMAWNIFRMGDPFWPLLVLLWRNKL